MVPKFELSYFYNNGYLEGFGSAESKIDKKKF